MGEILGRDGAPIRERPPITVRQDGGMVVVCFAKPLEGFVFDPETALRFASAIQKIAQGILLKVAGLLAEETPAAKPGAPAAPHLSTTGDGCSDAGPK